MTNRNISTHFVSDAPGFIQMTGLFFCHKLNFCIGMILYHLLITDATSANTIERVVASRTFAVVQTTQGKV